MIKEFSTFVHARLQTLAKALNSPLHGFWGRPFDIFCSVLWSSRYHATSVIVI